MFKQISVTEDHINKGRRMAAKLCPIALACSEQWYSETIIGGDTATVGGQWAYKPGARRAYDLPRSAVRFIRRFDEGLKVKPFNFRVAL